MKITDGFALLLCLWSSIGLNGQLAAQQNPEPTAKEFSAKASSENEETEALRKAFRAAEDNPQALIKNLEDFLAHFPESSRREQIVHTIYQEALQANMPDTAIVYGEKLLEINPDDAKLLSTLMDLLDRTDDPASRLQAIQCATRLIEVAEKQGRDPAPPDVSKADWKDRWSERVAVVYARRAMLFEKSGKMDRALADFEGSYSTYPNSLAAEHLGDLAAKKGDLERAINYYATAFAFPDRQIDQPYRADVRRKLGKLYVERHRSEEGLGDLILSRYDELMRQLAPRFECQQPASDDTGNPFDYVLQRPDGSTLHMGEFRGKVLVVDFWATWCPPCRVEGKLLARVMETFRNEPRAAFLALNVNDDPASVRQFLKNENWTVPVAYAQGLARVLRVRSLPTLVIFDQKGHIIFRQEGLDLDSFVSTLEKRVHNALQPTPSSAANSGQ